MKPRIDPEIGNLEFSPGIGSPAYVHTIAEREKARQAALDAMRTARDRSRRQYHQAFVRAYRKVRAEQRAFFAHATQQKA